MPKEKKEKTLEYLKEICKNCTKCELYKTRTNVVFGKGNEKARIMFIGEAPGNNEDKTGLPFVGSAGKKLNEQLNNIGLSIDNVYIANILKCRPPKNRAPKPNEIETCTPHLIEQINMIKPKIICTLGNYSTKFLLANCKIENMKSIDGITKLHGMPQKIKLDKNKKNNRNNQIIDNTNEQEYIVIPMYHPAATIYNRKLKEDFEKDFLILKEI
jgi:DNA polymerase